VCVCVCVCVYCVYVCCGRCSMLQVPHTHVQKCAVCHTCTRLSGPAGGDSPASPCSLSLLRPPSKRHAAPRFKPQAAAREVALLARAGRAAAGRRPATAPRGLQRLDAPAPAALRRRMRGRGSTAGQPAGTGDSAGGWVGGPAPSRLLRRARVERAAGEQGPFEIVHDEIVHDECPIHQDSL